MKKSEVYKSEIEKMHKVTAKFAWIVNCILLAIYFSTFAMSIQRNFLKETIQLQNTYLSSLEIVLLYFLDTKFILFAVSGVSVFFSLWVLHFNSISIPHYIGEEEVESMKKIFGDYGLARVKIKSKDRKFKVYMLKEELMELRPGRIVDIFQVGKIKIGFIGKNA